MKCPSCKSIYFPWYPCCYQMGDNKRRKELLIRAGLLPKEESEEKKEAGNGG